MTILESSPSKRAVAWQLIWFATWVGVTGLGISLHPDPAGHGTHQELGLPPCPVALLFDRPCPGCGLTTSWTSLLHGNLTFAFHAHPLGPPLYLLFTVSAFTCLWGFLKTRRFVLDSVEMSWALGTLAVVFLGFGLVRMATTPHYRTLKEQMMIARSR